MKTCLKCGEEEYLKSRSELVALIDSSRTEKIPCKGCNKCFLDLCIAEAAYQKMVAPIFFRNAHDTKGVVILDVSLKFVRYPKNGKDVWLRGRRVGRFRLACIYDYDRRKYFSYDEHNVRKLLTRLEAARVVVGYNLYLPDIAILSECGLHPSVYLRCFDIGRIYWNALGTTTSLDGICNDLFGIGNSFKKGGKIKYKSEEDYEQACREDVMLTRKIFEYWLRNGKSGIRRWVKRHMRSCVRHEIRF